MGPRVTLKVEQELLKFTEGCSVLTSLNERGNEQWDSAEKKVRKSFDIKETFQLAYKVN